MPLPYCTIRIDLLCFNIWNEPLFTILAIDDEPELINSIKRLFIRKNYSVLSAATGEEALKTLEIHHVDVVILDLRLPDISGLSVLNTIKMSYRIGEAAIHHKIKKESVP